MEKVFKNSEKIRQLCGAKVENEGDDYIGTETYDRELWKEVAKQRFHQNRTIRVGSYQKKEHLHQRYYGQFPTFDQNKF